MRKRNIRYSLWLNEKEAERLNKIVNKSGLQREVYLRQLINGLIPTDQPPPNYYNMMNQLREVGKSLSQIAQSAHLLNAIDSENYKKAYDEYKDVVLQIIEAVMLPRKVELWRPPQSGQ